MSNSISHYNSSKDQRSKNKRETGKKTNTSEIYKIVTEKVIANLNKAGSWRKLWQAPTPISLNGHIYHGINFLLLSLLKDYETPVYGTFNQIKANGGKVNKGEKSSMIVFWKKYIAENKETGIEEDRYCLKTYNVFNVQQATFNDIGERKINELVSRVKEKNNSKHISSENIINNMPDAPGITNPKIIKSPCYKPTSDIVCLPDIKWYNNSDTYYNTLFHELIHSTGHPKRLHRFELNDDRRDIEKYSKEELVAELGASCLTEIAGLKLDVENSSAYIKSWSKALRENEKWLVWAIGKAEKASNFILNIEDNLYQ